MGSPASGRISVPGRTQVPDGSRSVFAYGTVTLSGWLSHTILLTGRLLTPHCQVLQPPGSRLPGFGLFPVRSPLLGEWSLFLWVLRCFSSPGSLPQVYVFNLRILKVRLRGFPHSDIPGSRPVHGSPRLFAVSHVLHRRLAPRHPP